VPKHPDPLQFRPDRDRRGGPAASLQFVRQDQRSRSPRWQTRRPSTAPSRKSRPRPRAGRQPSRPLRPRKDRPWKRPGRKPGPRSASAPRRLPRASVLNGLGDVLGRTASEPRDPRWCARRGDPHHATAVIRRHRRRAYQAPSTMSREGTAFLPERRRGADHALADDGRALSRADANRSSIGTRHLEDQVMRPGWVRRSWTSTRRRAGRTPQTAGIAPESADRGSCRDQREGRGKPRRTTAPPDTNPPQRLRSASGVPVNSVAREKEDASMASHFP